MVQPPLSFNAIVLLFTIFVTVSSRPTPVKENLIAARQFDPLKALQKRGTKQSLDLARRGEEKNRWGGGPYKPQPSPYYNNEGQGY
jgi:hypothetical protein